MKKIVAFLVLSLAALALVSCGGGDDDSPTTTATSGGESTAAGGGAAKEEKEEGGGGGGSTVEFEADPGGGLAYTSDSASAEAGEVTIELNNPQGLVHDVQIEDSAGEDVGGTEVISESSDSATVELEPGTYTFYCSVPGHREAGMEGTLTVE